MENQNLYFRLFASCVAIKGAKHGLIYDLNREEAHPITNLIIEVLEQAKTKTVKELKDFYEGKYNNGIDAFFSQFYFKELGFYTDEPDHFPPIDLSWENPHLITNAILEVTNSSNYDIIKALQQLDALGCVAIQLRFLSVLPISFIRSTLKSLEQSRIRMIECFIPQSPNYSIEDISKLAEKSRITNICMYGNKFQKYNHEKVYSISQTIHPNMQDIIHPKNFSLNIAIFTEAQKHNLGLNRKVCIDFQGNIKNYVSHLKNFGHINTTKLAKIITTQDFQEKWYISNDQIHQCQDCPYRYVCLSNSDLEKKEGIWHKTHYCSYNPYQGKWTQKPSLVTIKK